MKKVFFTPDQILSGIKSGAIKVSTSASCEPICIIGNQALYFAGEEGRGKTAAEYLAVTPEEDVAREIAEAVNGLCNKLLTFPEYVSGILSDKTRENAPKREFYVDTPVGKLHVYAKHNVDSPEDFPGVFIDICREGEPDDMLVCTEWESCDKRLESCVYEAGKDEPVFVFHHKTGGDDDE